MSNPVMIGELLNIKVFVVNRRDLMVVDRCPPKVSFEDLMSREEDVIVVKDEKGYKVIKDRTGVFS